MTHLPIIYLCQSLCMCVCVCQASEKAHQVSEIINENFKCHDDGNHLTRGPKTDWGMIKNSSPITGPSNPSPSHTYTQTHPLHRGQTTRSSNLIPFSLPRLTLKNIRSHLQPLLETLPTTQYHHPLTLPAPPPLTYS